MRCQPRPSPLRTRNVRISLRVRRDGLRSVAKKSSIKPCRPLREHGRLSCQSSRKKNTPYHEPDRLPENEDCTVGGEHGISPCRSPQFSGSIAAKRGQHALSYRRIRAAVQSGKSVWEQLWSLSLK